MPVEEPPHKKKKWNNQHNNGHSCRFNDMTCSCYMYYIQFSIDQKPYFYVQCQHIIICFECC